jgi:hypothetical protein
MRDLSLRLALFTSMLALSGSASAQIVLPHATYTYTMTEVLAGTSTPSNMSPGVIEPGEGVRFTINMSWDEPIGASGTFGTFFGPVSGQVVGWRYSNFTFICPTEFTDHTIDDPGSIGAIAAATGFNASMSLAFLTPNLDVESTSLFGVPVNQFQPLVSFTWTPGVYTPRTVNWYVADHGLAGGATGIGHAFVVQHQNQGGATISDIAAALSNFAPAPSVVIVPAPASLVLLASGAMAMTRRSRA